MKRVITPSKRYEGGGHGEGQKSQKQDGAAIKRGDVAGEDAEALGET